MNGIDSELLRLTSNLLFSSQISPEPNGPGLSETEKTQVSFHVLSCSCLPRILSEGMRINIHDRRSLTLMIKLDVSDVACNISQFLKMSDKFWNPLSISPMRPEKARQSLKASLRLEEGYYLFGGDNSLTFLILLCLYYKDSG